MTGNLRPVVILVSPQLGENIGKCARAMLNFGFSELRLVDPRDGWPNPDAGPAASGADKVLEHAQLYPSLRDALADCHFAVASTVRNRDMPKPVYTPEQVTKLMLEREASGQKCAFIMGPERAGLDNEDVALAHAIVTIPVNPAFGSLNLAQALVVLVYEYSRWRPDSVQAPSVVADPLATHDEMSGLFKQLEGALDASGYFRSADRRAHQIRALRTLLLNAEFSSQAVRTLRGMIKSLARDRAMAVGDDERPASS